MARTDNYTLGAVTSPAWSAGGLGTVLFEASSANHSSHKSAITVRRLNADDDGDGGLRWMDKVGAMGSTLVNALISVGRLTDDHESTKQAVVRPPHRTANRRQIAGDTIFNRPTFVASDDFRSSSSCQFLSE